jgi:phage regulator Rha-like protein
MGEILNFTNPSNLTMSSREIAELVEKRHDNVKRTIESLVEQEVIIRPQIEDEQFTDAMGRPRAESVYQLQKRDTYIVVAQLSPEFTARLVDRWQELESAAADPMKALSDPATMRSLLLTYTEKVINLEHKVEILEPKAEALDRIATHSEGSFCIRDAAKILQVQEKKLKQLLHEKGWTYRRLFDQNLRAYAPILKNGLMEHKTTTGDRGDGSEWIDIQARVTAKGMARLSQMLGGFTFN